MDTTFTEPDVREEWFHGTGSRQFETNCYFAVYGIAKEVQNYVQQFCCDRVPTQDWTCCTEHLHIISLHTTMLNTPNTPSRVCTNTRECDARAQAHDLHARTHTHKHIACLSQRVGQANSY